MTNNRNRRPDRNQQVKRSLLLNAELGAGMNQIDEDSREILAELEAMIDECSPEDPDARLSMMPMKMDLLEKVVDVRRADTLAKERHKFDALARFQIPMGFTFPEDMKPGEPEPLPENIDGKLEVAEPATDDEPAGDELTEAAAAAALAKMREEGKV